MKKLYLLLIAAAVLLASCSDEDTNSTDTTNSSFLTLKKVDIYYPSFEGYNTDNESSRHQVQYFESGLIVADTIYNYEGGLYASTVRTTNGNISTETTSYIESETPEVYTFTYDALGRIVNHHYTFVDSDVEKTMTYNDDGSVTVSTMYFNNPNEVNVGTYTPNETGILSFYNDDLQQRTLTYQDGKPYKYTVTIGEQEVQSFTFTYYSVALPANRIKTVTQVNNIILINDYLALAADNTTDYIKTYEGLINYQSTFNSLGYVTNSLYNAGAIGTSKEVFYYYNE